MKRLFILLLALTLSASINTSAEQTQPTGKREQRKLKKQTEIENALNILKSGQFKISEPTTRDRLKSGYFNEKMMRVVQLDISDPRIKTMHTETDTVNNVYTINFTHKSEYEGFDRSYKIVYNFKTGYLRVDGSPIVGRLPTSEGNYTYITPLDEPRK